MSAASALSVGALNAFRSTRETAIPSAWAVIALFIALTISLTLLVSEPVHWYEQPSRLHASAAPYLVGTKNGLVVTWLTNVNLNDGCEPKTLDAFADDVLVPPPPQASSISAAAPAAPPVRA